jgi:CcmD family protein
MNDSKLIVVIVVLATVFLGLAAYLFTIDRKISRLEKQMKEKDEK